MINQSMAERHWPNEDPIGQRVGYDPVGANIWYEVVGVVSDIRYGGPGNPIKPEMYLALSQAQRRDLTALLSTLGDPSSVAADARQAVAAVGRDIPVFAMQTLMRGVADATAESRYRAGLVTGFGLIAVLLTTAGLYALLAGRVVQRRRELAIRVAIGADPRCLVAMVLRQAARLLVPANGIGAMAAVVSVRLLSSQLFGISPWDAASFASAALGLLAAGLAAAYVPARQAARIDPIAALRAE